MRSLPLSAAAAPPWSLRESKRFFVNNFLSPSALVPTYRLSRSLAGGDRVAPREPWTFEIEKLYKEMYSTLYAYALRVLKNSALAEEAS